MTEIAIGVDLGGTKIACAAVNREGQILASHTEPTLSEEGVDAVIGRIVTCIQAVRGDHAVAGIGIGAPGPVVDGVAINAVNLGWRNVPLVAKVRERLMADVPVSAQNDVKAGTVAEMVFGAARGARDFVYLAVGTGMAGGAVADGRLLGSGGLAMEVGHVVIHRNGRLCTCGNHGCVEMYCSGKGVVAGARVHLPDYPQSALAGAELTTRRIIEAARTGDPLALAVFEEAADALGVAMAWSVTALNPTLLVLGGGFASAAHDLLFEQTQAAMRARLLSDVAARIQVARSQVESSALGAAALVWHELAE